MANMIKELWYGNIVPQEDEIFSKPKFKELLGYIARHREALEATMTAEQKELYSTVSSTVYPPPKMTSMCLSAYTLMHSTI